MEYLSHNVPLNQIIIAKLIVTYRKVTAQKLLYLFPMVELSIFEPVPISIHHIRSIVGSFFLRRVVFNLIHAADNTGEYNTCYRLEIRFS